MGMGDLDPRGGSFRAALGAPMWVVVALVSSCRGAESPPTTTPAAGPVSSDGKAQAPPTFDLPSRGGFAGLGIGEPASLEPPRFVAAGRAGDFKLTGDTFRVGGVALPDAVFRVGDDGRLSNVRLSASSDDPAEAERLRELAVEVCDGIKAPLDVEIPSPLGTPEPGETWDPVITESGTCAANRDGVRVHVRSEHNSASDFARMDLTITVATVK